MGHKTLGGIKLSTPTAPLYRKPVTNRYGQVQEERVPVKDARQDFAAMQRYAHQEIQWQQKPHTLVLARVEQPGSPPYFAVVSYGLWTARERSGIVGTMVSVELYETLGRETHGDTKEEANRPKNGGSPDGGNGGKSAGRNGGRRR